MRIPTTPAIVSRTKLRLSVWDALRGCRRWLKAGSRVDATTGQAPFPEDRRQVVDARNTGRGPLWLVASRLSNRMILMGQMSREELHRLVDR